MISQSCSRSNTNNITQCTKHFRQIPNKRQKETDFRNDQERKTRRTLDVLPKRARSRIEKSPSLSGTRTMSRSLYCTRTYGAVTFFSSARSFRLVLGRPFYCATHNPEIIRSGVHCVAKSPKNLGRLRFGRGSIGRDPRT